MNSSFLFSEIRSCFEKLDQDLDCRVVVLTGAGKAFSSGSTFLLMSVCLSLYGLVHHKFGVFPMCEKASSKRTQ